MNKVNNKKDETMIELIAKIENCEENCYCDRYTRELRTKNRVISIEELKAGKPLVDSWRGQEILFISQAPSKQAWADEVLNSEDNEFLTNILLRRMNRIIARNKTEAVTFQTWFSKVFWIHVANCYPFVNAKNRDRIPDMRCSNKWLSKVIENINPKCIILMGRSATRLFNNSISKQIGIEKTYPSLKEILRWQYLNKSLLKVTLEYSITEYPVVVLPHAAWPYPEQQYEEYAYIRAAEIINGNKA